MLAVLPSPLKENVTKRTLRCQPYIESAKKETVVEARLIYLQLRPLWI